MIILFQIGFFRLPVSTYYFILFDLRLAGVPTALNKENVLEYGLSSCYFLTSQIVLKRIFYLQDIQPSRRIKNKGLFKTGIISCPSPYIEHRNPHLLFKVHK